MSYDANLLQKQTGHIILPLEKIKTTGTTSLLRIYKSLHSYTGTDRYYEECNCIDIQFYAYKEAVKAELSTREHVPKKKQGSPNPKRDLVLLKKKIRDRKYYNLPEQKIREMYNEQTGAGFYCRNDYGFKGFQLNQILALVRAIKASKNNQEKSK